MLFSLIQTLRQIPLAVVDVETTGASADLGHRIIEIGIARIENGQVVAEYEQLLDPLRPISPGVTALTGISQVMVAGQPTFADELCRITELMKGAIPVGHNIPFDLSFLRREFRRNGSDLAEALGDVPVLDTVRIARRRFGRGGNALQILCRRLEIFPDVAHRALADVRTTLGVLAKMLEPIGGWDIQLADALLAQGGKLGLSPANPRQPLLPLELEEALDHRRPVLMEYVDAKGSRSQRVIEPLHVRRLAGELVLVAHCNLRGARRTFKLDRMVQLKRIEPGMALPQSCDDHTDDVEAVGIKMASAVADLPAATSLQHEPVSAPLGEGETTTDPATVTVAPEAAFPSGDTTGNIT